MNIYSNPILIIDFGSQYTQLIARRIREIGVYSIIEPFDLDAEKLKKINPKGIILSGGPESVNCAASPKISDKIFDLGCPILGICYGMQALTYKFNGEIKSAIKCEYGKAKIILKEPSALFEGIHEEVETEAKLNKEEFTVWMSHGDHVEKLPEGFKVLAESESVEIAAIFNEDKKYYGLQFHPEVTHTSIGKYILANFVLKVCNAKSNWIPKNIVNELITEIRTKILHTDKVILALSGGVDSAVCAALLSKAIGKRLHCVFVDNGLLRLKESDAVMDVFSNFDLNLIKIDARERFLTALQTITDPEAKRKKIGNLFIDIFQEESEKLTGIKWLAQGTIYPDVIESAGNEQSKAKVIKSHHNVGGLPEKMSLNLIEPLRNLFKDEVKKIGVELELPNHLINRHPFPGPGLAVRVLGEVKEKYLQILQKADAIFTEVLKKYDWYNKVSQSFVVFLPLKSVGVKGDCRSYEYVVSLRAVETTDFMTATAAKLPYDLLDEASNRILNEVAQVSRVCYDISSKPPSTIEWE